MTVTPFKYGWTRALTAIACAIVSLYACTAPDPATTQDVVDSVRAWVEAYERAWNTHEASAVAAFFSEDADLIVGNGPRIVGRDAVEEAWRTYFSGIDDGREGAFAIASLRAITPEVVVVDINSTTAGHGRSGEELPTRLARGTWVVAQRDGKWQISVFRAFPAEGEVRFGPGRDR